VRASRPRFRPSQEDCERLTAAFGAAAQSGDTQALTGLLAEDVAYYSDAGGKAPAALRPIIGRDKVIRLIKGLGTKGFSTIREVRPVQINGVPGFIMERTNGQIIAVSFDFQDGCISNIYLMLNPDKLRHLSAS
jgi:RNA polymerase sigma-70 factor (ECF subfamily)